MLPAFLHHRAYSGEAPPRPLHGGWYFGTGGRLLQLTWPRATNYHGLDGDRSACRRLYTSANGTDSTANTRRLPW